jgi:small subunit ribosomal protein S15
MRPYKTGVEAEKTMTLTKDSKTTIIKEFKKNENDTGSCQVQIALLTERINALGGHFKQHVKDNHSRRGLLKLVSTRRRLLTYLQREDTQEYQKILGRLKLRK